MSTHAAPVSTGQAKLDLSVYLVADADTCNRIGADLPSIVAASVAGGATCVQLRAKDAPGGAFVDLACEVARVLPAHVPLLINDRVDVALAVRARGLPCAGVHVGQSDISVEDARALLGPDAIIGLSASTPEQLAAAVASPARVDCVGIGPLHSTRTKLDAPDGLGHEAVARLAAACPLPAVAIGGVTPEDMPLLRAGGLQGGAVVSYICCAEDPEAATRALVTAWEGAR